MKENLQAHQAHSGREDNKTQEFLNNVRHNKPIVIKVSYYIVASEPLFKQNPIEEDQKIDIHLLNFP